MQYVYLYVVAVSAATSTALFVFAFVPGYRKLLLREDMFAETLSALTFLAAALISLNALFRFRNNRSSDTRILWLIVLLGIVCFGDELSWGERIFALDAPVVAGVKIDALHDVFYLIKNALTVAYQSNATAVILLTVCCLSVAVAVAYRHRHSIDQLRINVDVRPYLILGAGFVVSGAVSTFIDFEFVRWRLLFVIEEMAELSAGLALVFAAMYGRHRLLRQFPAGRPMAPT